MFTPAQMLAMTDNELGTHASGGYGAAKRNEFYASLREHLKKADAKGQIISALRGGPGRLNETASEQRA